MPVESGASSRMATVYSFDVFDTALTRRVALPADIFRLTARALAPSVETSALIDFEAEFVSARIAAERAARARVAPREDCTLEDIWRELRALMPSLPADATAELEVAAERGTIIANPHLAAHIKGLQAAGHRVIFISDIYYSRETVFALLESAGLVSRIEQVYVSSEAGLLKATGNLFPHVAQAEGIRTSDLIHLGDNPVSDGSAARRAGARSTVYHASRLNAAERAILTAYEDQLTGSRLAAAMRTARLAHHQAGQGSLVSAFLGPLAVMIAAWAFRHAADIGAGRVYFVARDGYVPWRAAAAMAPAFPETEPRYVKLSRHALVAAIPELGDFGVFWIEQSWSKRSLGEIAALMGCDWADLEAAVREQLPHLGRDQLLANSEDARRFVSILDADRPGTVSAAERAELRDAALRFLRDAGLMDDTPYLTVDVGWFLNLQAALTALLRAENARGFAGGLYLGLCNGRTTPERAGPSRALIYQQPYAPDLAGSPPDLFDRIILIEHLLGLAPHGTAKGYSEGPDGVAVVEGPISPERKAMAERIGDEIAAFAASTTDFAASLGDEAGARRAIEVLMAHFFAEPQRYDLSQLEAFEVQSDSVQRDRMHVVQPWRLSTAVLQAIPYRVRVRLNLSHGPTLWPEASLTRTSRGNRAALQVIRNARKVAGRLMGRRK